MSIDHDRLEALLKRVKALKVNIKSQSALSVGRVSVRHEAKALGSIWHKDFVPALKYFLSAESLENYNSNFTQLIKLSSPNNKVSSYLEALDAIIKPFKDELLVPSQQGTLQGHAPTAFDAFFALLTSAEEGDYLAEAIACANAKHYRAAAVLGWSAAIDRIHRVIDARGIDKFNAMSQQMHVATAGRYKRFNNKGQIVANIGELREVFDTAILWVIEGMQLIDTNQHARLSACFEIRCHSAHPGDAPITPYNLMSFFSDLEQIVFKNPKFQLVELPSAQTPPASQ